MPFCYYSKDLRDEGYTLVENLFLTDFMPACSEIQLKVYLYGLHLCSQPLSRDNTAAQICDALSLSEAQVTEAFGFWAETGAVSIVSYDPLQIQYRPVRHSGAGKHYKKEKYADFNAQLESVFSSVAFVNPNQYLQYYDFIEETKIQPEVMLMIIRYCVSLKGESIKPAYVLAVARNWISEGVRTVSDVETRIKQFETVSESMRVIARAIGKKSEITLEDKQLYVKWTQTWGFSLDAVLAAAKNCKNRGGMTRLDNLLDEYFRNNRMSVADIRDYTENKERLFDIAKQVNKMLGLWYENLDFEVEKYIAPWLSKGFDEAAIKLIAEYCFTNSIRTLEGMNGAMQRFLKEGCMSVDAINRYLGELIERDNAVRKLISLTGSSRNVTNSDRDLYHNWTVNWGFDRSLVEHAAQLACGRPYAFGYINQLLGKWRTAGITTVEQAKTTETAAHSVAPQAQTSAQFNAADRKFTKEELNAFFDGLDDTDHIEV